VGIINADRAPRRGHLPEGPHDGVHHVPAMRRPVPLQRGKNPGFRWQKADPGETNA
jgi:hypothetical protein